MLSDVHASAEDMAARHRAIGQSAVEAIRRDLRPAYLQPTEDPRRSLAAIEAVIPEYGAFMAEARHLALQATSGKPDAIPSDLLRCLGEMGKILESAPTTLRAGIRAYKMLSDTQITTAGGPAAAVAQTRALLLNGEGQLGHLEFLRGQIRQLLKDWLQSGAARPVAPPPPATGPSAARPTPGIRVEAAFDPRQEQ